MATTKKVEDPKDIKYNGTPTDKPTLKSAPTLPEFNDVATSLPTTNTTRWDDTAKGSAALGAIVDAKNAVTGYGDFTFSKQGWLNDILSNIQNYGDFSYDMNGDALYQQYKDKYIQQGKMAMADTMGQAAAMNGGYGSSYAQSVGQQAYQGQLQNLNDIVPELAQMAYDKWNAGKQDLYNQYGLASSERENEYGLYQDKYGRLMDAYGIASDDYYRGADMYHNEQDRANAELWNQYDAKEDARQYGNSLIQQGYENEFNQWSADNENTKWSAEWDEMMRQSGNDEWWRNKEFDESVRQHDETMDYTKEQDKLEQENWEKQYDLSERELLMREDAYDLERQEAGYGAYLPEGEEQPGNQPEGEEQPKGTVRPDTISAFNKYVGSKSKYNPNNHGGKTYEQYLESVIASFLRDDRINEAEALKLIQDYGLK